MENKIEKYKEILRILYSHYSDKDEVMKLISKYGKSLITETCDWAFDNGIFIRHIRVSDSGNLIEWQEYEERFRGLNGWYVYGGYPFSIEAEELLKSDCEKKSNIRKMAFWEEIGKKEAKLVWACVGSVITLVILLVIKFLPIILSQ